MKSYIRGSTLAWILLLTVILGFGYILYQQYFQSYEQETFRDDLVGKTYPAVVSLFHAPLYSESHDHWYANTQGKTVDVYQVAPDQFTCDNAPASVALYSSTKNSDTSRLNNVYVVDCGNYYFVFSDALSGQVMYGPFTVLE